MMANDCTIFTITSEISRGDFSKKYTIMSTLPYELENVINSDFHKVFLERMKDELASEFTKLMENREYEES